MNVHNWIRDIPYWVMGINDSLMDVNIQLCMSIVEFWIAIISNNDHAMDSHNRIMVIQNSVMDIHN